MSNKPNNPKPKIDPSLASASQKSQATGSAQDRAATVKVDPSLVSVVQEQYQGKSAPSLEQAPVKIDKDLTSEVQLSDKNSS